MFYEEALIEGVFCCRSAPDGEWRKLTEAQLTERLLARTAELQGVRTAVQGYYRALDTRQHGGVAQDKAFKQVEQALGMSWSG